MALFTAGVSTAAPSPFAPKLLTSNTGPTGPRSAGPLWVGSAKPLAELNVAPAIPAPVRCKKSRRLLLSILISGISYGFLELNEKNNNLQIALDSRTEEFLVSIAEGLNHAFRKTKRCDGLRINWRFAHQRAAASRAEEKRWE